MSAIKNVISKFNPTVVWILIILAAFFIMISVTSWIFDLLKQEEREQHIHELAIKTKDNLVTAMQTTSHKMFSYNELQKYLRRTGVEYMSAGRITPLVYIIIRIVLILGGFLIGLSVDLGTAFVISILAVILPEVIINVSNNTDELQMLKDLKSMYDLLRIQGKAGTFLTDSLAEVYLIVENKRLKAACLRLSNDISSRVDLKVAVDNFGEKFDNQYINALTVIIKQSLESGKSVKMLDDMKQQLVDIEQMIILMEKQKIQRYITICQVIIYAVVIMVSILVAMIGVTSSMEF